MVSSCYAEFPDCGAHGSIMGLLCPGMTAFISLCHERTARGQKIVEERISADRQKKQGTVLENDPLHEV